LPTTTVASAGKLTTSGTSSDALSKTSSRNGIIKNFMSTSFIGEVSTATAVQTGTLQASALCLNGPNFTTKEKSRDFISYVYKSLEESKYKHFGTRMRIVGKIQGGANNQSPVGATTMFTIPGTTPDKNINIVGGSGGLGIMVNPETNNGYFLELVALGTNDITSPTL
jgi:hypothetical protein